MGRGKLKAELITNERSRMITYQKRKRGLIKKVEEFNILCNVDACVIIYRPQLNYRPADLEVWPADSDKIRRIINRYRNDGPDVRARKTQDLSDYFVGRKKKVEDEIAKLRKASVEASFPWWSNDLNLFTLQQLLGLEKALDAKIEAVERRILETRANVQGNYSGTRGAANDGCGTLVGPSSLLPYNLSHAFNQRNLEPELLDRQQPIPSMKFQFDTLMPPSYPCDQTTHHQMLPFTANPIDNSMWRLLVNGEDISQFGGSTSHKIPHGTPFKDTSSYYDPSFTSVLENAKFYNFPAAYPASCSSPGVPPAMPYMQGAMLPYCPTQAFGPEISELYHANQFEVAKKGSI